MSPAERRRQCVTATWIPVEGLPGRPCDGKWGCGHEHLGWEEWTDRGKTNLAPQWTWCVDADCGCKTLRRASISGPRVPEVSE